MQAEAQLVHDSVIISKMKCPWKTRVLFRPPPGGFPSMLPAAPLSTPALAGPEPRLLPHPAPWQGAQPSDLTRMERHRGLALAARAVSLLTDALRPHWSFPIPRLSGPSPWTPHLWKAQAEGHDGSPRPGCLLGRLMDPLATVGT